jgi:hypothetical protein
MLMICRISFRVASTNWSTACGWIESFSLQVHEFNATGTQGFSYETHIYLNAIVKSRDRSWVAGVLEYELY